MKIYCNYENQYSNNVCSTEMKFWHKNDRYSLLWTNHEDESYHCDERHHCDEKHYCDESPYYD